MSYLTAVKRGRGFKTLLEAMRWSWLLVAFLVAWEVLFRTRESLFVPPFSTILVNTLQTWFSSDPTTLFTSEIFRDNALPSLVRFAWGWGIAVITGIVWGLMLGLFPRLEAFCKPIVRFGVSTPPTILLPVAVVLFGITDRMNIFLIAVGAIWPILLNTIAGIRGIEPAILYTARSLRLRRRQFFSRVILPAASPQIFAGLRVSLSIALILVVISEIFVATQGIGFQIVYSQRTFSFVDMWSAVTLIGLLSIVLNGGFFLAERRILGWHHKRGGELG